MERITRFRAHIFLLIFALVLGFFAFRLYYLQVIETGGSTDNSTTYVTLTRVKAARGEILDRNGTVLVSNRASYDLVINHFVLLNASGTNQYLYQLTKLCQEKGIEYNDSFPMTKERPFTSTLHKQNSAQQSYYYTYLAYMGNLDADISEALLIKQLRDIYELPVEWTDEEARLVIGLRYELALRNCVSSLSNFVFLSDASDDALSSIVELNIPGMTPEASTVREIHTKYAAHIIGYVGRMTSEQWEYYKDIDGYQMDAEIGQDGFEAEFEEYLHGVDGWREDTVAPDGTLISSRFLTEPKAGTNVEVSIDIDLQGVAEEAMAVSMAALNAKAPGSDGCDAEGCAVVAMDLTGQVLVCASYPTYDLSTFFENYDEIIQQPNNPLFNRALLAAYPPGSTYKMSTLIAAMENKLLDSDDIIVDKGKFDKYDGFSVNCMWYSLYYATHGELTAAGALEVSCNYFFYELGDRLRLSMLDSTAKSLGLGEPTGIELPEAVGHRANEETRAKIHPDSPIFYQGDQIQAAIGQSDNRFTPMQLCVYVSTLANQGKRYRATFLNRIVSADYESLVFQSTPEILNQLEISNDTYKAYTDGMELVTTGFSGTAFEEFRYFPITVCGKTGTAEHDTSAVSSDHGGFICFAPKDDPQIAIAVYGEKVGHGNYMAVIAREILSSYFAIGEAADVTTYENQYS